MAKSWGKEAVELVIEAKDDNKDLFMGDAADLMFHYLVLLSAKGYKLEEVVELLTQSTNKTKPDRLNYCM